MGQITPVQQQRRRKPEPQLTSQPPLPHAISLPWKHPLHTLFRWITCPLQWRASFSSRQAILATPSPAELVNLFNRSPKVVLKFGKIFDFEECDSEEKGSQEQHDNGAASPPPSPSWRKKQRIKTRTRTTHRRRILHPRLGRVRRPQESSKLSSRHHHRRGFAGPP